MLIEFLTSLQGPGWVRIMDSGFVDRFREVSRSKKWSPKYCLESLSGSC